MTATFRWGDHAVDVDGREFHLHPKQSDLLALLAKHIGHCVSRESCYRTLYQRDPLDEDLERMNRRVSYHVALLRRQLRGTGLIVESVVGAGLRLVGEINTDWSTR